MTSLCVLSLCFFSEFAKIHKPVGRWSPQNLQYFWPLVLKAFPQAHLGALVVSPGFVNVFLFALQRGDFLVPSSNPPPLSPAAFNLWASSLRNCSVSCASQLLNSSWFCLCYEIFCFCMKISCSFIFSGCSFDEYSHILILVTVKFFLFIQSSGSYLAQFYGFFFSFFISYIFFPVIFTACLTLQCWEFVFRFCFAKQLIDRCICFALRGFYFLALSSRFLVALTAGLHQPYQ